LPFPVVGIGASAGGQEAVTQLLEHLPANPGMAIILVVHLDPHHESMLSSILARHCRLRVREAANAMAVEVDALYVIPPNTSMTLRDGHIGLRPRAPGPHMPIDTLFRSLAAVQHNLAIGVVLSGGGTDGTLGLHEISVEGIAFAQDEHTARHDAMPRSAIAAGCVDFILSPADIARELLRIVRHPFAARPPASDKAAAEEGSDLHGLYAVLRSTLNIDFTHYKKTTISRRVQRRMALRNIDQLADYVRLLADDAAEVRALAQDLLIRVTRFFRDPASYQALHDTVFPRLLRERVAQDPLRIWVAGCATGEEVYSLAIALLEFLGDMATNTPIKILATDVNHEALEKARTGVYCENIELDVSAERLRRFFFKLNGHYQVSHAVRDLCVFSRHNLVSDTPYSRLDLISCRNVLIYFDLALQKRVLPLFHYALKPGGFLLLGGSESIGSRTDLFSTVNDQQRIFVRQPAAVPAAPVSFEPSPLVRRQPQPAAPAMEDAVDQRLAHLQHELAASREYLQSVIQEHERVNEELKAAHEEILSSNEELQSTNEELQSAKEEMQSANEELTTVNDELRFRNDELSRLNDDLANLFGGVNLPIVMVSHDLRIRRMTPLAEKVFNLLPSDLGRPIGDIRPNLDIPDFERAIAEVAATLTVKDLEARDRAGRWYSVRIRPYVTLDSKIDGASIVGVEIDVLKRSLEQTAQARNLAEAVIDAVQQPLLVLDANLHVQRANAAFLALTDGAPDQTLQRPPGAAGPGPVGPCAAARPAGKRAAGGPGLREFGAGRRVPPHRPARPAAARPADRLGRCAGAAGAAGDRGRDGAPAADGAGTRAGSGAGGAGRGGSGQSHQG